MDFIKFIIIIATLFLSVNISSAAESNSSIVPYDLRTEYLTYPLTLETPNPRFSWKLRATNDSAHNLTQSAYQIVVFTTVHNNATSSTVQLWDSGVVKSDDTVHIRYAGVALKSRQLASWKVKVWDQNDQIAESNIVGQFGIGLLHSGDWKAQWIHSSNAEVQKDVRKTLQNEDQTVMTNLAGLMSPLYFRKTFHHEQTHTSARLFATAKGIYEIFINGQRLQMSHLKPGYSDYRKSFRYQSFENIDQHLRVGENVIGIVVASGWYASYLGYRNTAGLYGTDLGALVQLDIDDVTVVKSDDTWKVATGPIVFSDLYMGETYYVDKEIRGWNDDINFNVSHWKQVTVENRSETIALIGDVSEPVVTSMTLTPKTMHEPKPGVFIFDFGQNFAGVCSITIREGQGPSRIQLRHGEALEQPYMSGSLYTGSNRNARAIDTLVIKEKVTKSFTYTPSFTYHGFRFVEVTGYGPIAPNLTNIAANVMHSGFRIDSHMETSNELVNRLLQNIQWGLRSNFMSVPTDCPQRGERLGWTADAQVFAPTAVYNADLAAFYTQWMQEMRQSQAIDGSIPDTVPRYEPSPGSPGWQDAMVVLPWVVYRTYGDEQIIKDNYDAMVKFIDYVTGSNPEHIWTNRIDHTFGDWLEVNAQTDKHVVSTAFYAQDALLMSKMASVLGKSVDAKKYTELFHNISYSFNKHYVQPDGTIHGDTQTSYALALAFQLLPESVSPLAAAKLADNIKQHKTHLTVGFMGVSVLNLALTEHGHNELAYRLLLQDSYPSWLYPIVHANATTFWENWGVWTETGGFEREKSSFNHYALGSVGEWLYSMMAGIASDDEGGITGFKHIIIKPNPGPGLTRINATYESIRGPITSSWTVNGDTVDYSVTIPVNTKATIILPGQVNKHEVGSGTWKYSSKKNF